MTTPAVATLRIYQNEEESTTRTTKIPSRSQLLLASVSSEFNAFWYNSIILRIAVCMWWFFTGKVNMILKRLLLHITIYTQSHTHMHPARAHFNISAKAHPHPHAHTRTHTRTHTHTPTRTRTRTRMCTRTPTRTRTRTHTHTHAHTRTETLAKMRV